MKNRKKVLLFNVIGNNQPVVLGDYEIHSYDVNRFIEEMGCRSIQDFLFWGMNGFSVKRSITASAFWVDELYRSRNKVYMELIDDFVSRFSGFYAIVMGTYNFIHPDVLRRRFQGVKKILGFVDDPFSTYTRGIPYLWAFDAAFYISPSYFNELSFSENIKEWSGGKPSYFWPLVPRPLPYPNSVDADFFAARTTKVSYVGNHNGNKVDKLISLKTKFGDDFKINGRWPLKGYSGLTRLLSSKKPFWGRVRSISNDERRALYWNTKIGFNMHVSNDKFETGNMRMYEVPAHGAMLLCDKAALDAHEEIFKDGEEAVYYDDINDAIDKIEYYSSPEGESERIRIARNGFNRFWGTYEWEKNTLNFLKWIESIDI